MADRAPSVYTETFLRITGAGAQGGYTCPAGRRAVITSLLVSMTGGTPGFAQVICHDMVLYQASVPAGSATYPFSMRAVLYAGETLGGYTGVAGIYLVVSGYLFVDSSGADGPPLSASQLPDLGLPWTTP